jgi:uncharacterized protein with von Willebrand factor type A (vWA) domain
MSQGDRYPSPLAGEGREGGASANLARDGADTPLSTSPPQGGREQEGRLAENIAYFARALRAAGLPVGPGAVIDAVAAVEAARIGAREDFYWTLHAVFVQRHEHSALFDQAFRIFWRRRGLVEKLIAAMSPVAPGEAASEKPKPGALRVAEALQPPASPKPPPVEEATFSARLTMSDREILKGRDFAQMSAAEIAKAKRLVAELKLPDDEVATRRFVAAPHGRRIDPRRTFRRSLRAGSAAIELAFRARAVRHPPLVALVDVSGSMAEYSRLFLHFLHAVAERRRAVHSFVFATRLTNITRDLKARDPDEALAGAGARVKDWEGGTRIAAALHDFNRLWSRRVLGQGAITLLFTDGLEREVTPELAFEMDRLKRSCRRLIWLNPLLRYDAFEARAAGIRAMLPHVHDFRPIHNLASMDELCRALAAERARQAEPRRWLRSAA